MTKFEKLTFWIAQHSAVLALVTGVLLLARAVETLVPPVVTSLAAALALLGVVVCRKMWGLRP